MHAGELHHCEVVATPWPGVHATRIESARHFPRHWHDTYGVGLIDDGAHRSASARGTVDAGPGNVIATNPGEVHDGRPLGAPARRWRMVYMDATALQAGTLAPGEAPHHALALTRPVMDDPRLRGALQHLFACLAGDDRLALDEAWAATCGQLLARHGSTGSPCATAAPALARVRDRLADDLVDAPSLGELAAIAGLSRFQLLRRYAEAFGLPPHAWLRQQRVLRARALIARGSSLVQAAAAAGFADQSHMTRSFVQHLGYTPGAWRHAALQ